MRHFDPVNAEQFGVAIATLRQEGERLAHNKRISPEAFMALVLGLGVLKHAYEDANARNLGSDINVTVGHKEGA